MGHCCCCSQQKSQQRRKGLLGLQWPSASRPQCHPVLATSGARKSGRSPPPTDRAKPSTLREISPPAVILKAIGSGLAVCELGPEAADGALSRDWELVNKWS
jgi:hypothetical protein